MYLRQQNVWNEFKHEIRGSYLIEINWRNYLYCWSNCAFSIRLSLARLFWNHILICVSDSRKHSANSKRRLRDIYSFRWNSTSNRNVCSLLNVVLCRLGLPSFFLRLATNWITKKKKNKWKIIKWIIG